MKVSEQVTKWWENGGGAWTRRATYPVLIAIAGLFVFATLRGPQGVMTLLERRAEIRRLQGENSKLTDANEKLRLHLQQLKTNESERDNVIRRELNLARPNETTFILKPKK